MLSFRAFFTALCLILGLSTCVGQAQTASNDTNDWVELHSGNNVFALRKSLETNLGVSDGVRALAVAYIGAYSRDFDIATQWLGYAHRYARARGDIRFAQEVERVEGILLREQGRYQALASRLQRGPEAGTPLEKRVSFWSDTLTSAYIGADEFTLKNISPDNARIILPVSFSDEVGTLLFDTGAESSLLSSQFATKYHADLSGITFSMLTIDGPRATELARLPDLVVGAARFGEIAVGVQNQTDGVIGFFLNKGATGIMGFPLISRFGQIDFAVDNGRVGSLTIRKPGKRTRTGQEPNIMIREEKPYVKVDLDGQIYSCIFDTGAPRSLFSDKIVNRHARALGLDVLTEKAARKFGLSGDGKTRYLSSIPFRAGHREIELDHVHMVETARQDADFCLIGLDAVIEAGGAQLDMDNLHLSLGSVSDQTHAFNLR